MSGNASNNASPGETIVPAPAPNLLLEVVARDGNWPLSVTDAAFVARIAEAIANIVEVEGGEYATVAFSDDSDVQALNCRFRGIDKPTNVLSFPSLTDTTSMSGEDGAAFLGDIILARETVDREAGEQALAFDDHTAHLIVHGVLHLLGYDHESEAEAIEMETLEIGILAKLGIENPYTEELVDAG